MSGPPHALSRRSLLRRGLWLEYATLCWNVIGVAVTAVTATQARSVALAGFSLDSLIEILASLVVVWQLRGDHRDRERPALRLIAVAFLALSAYVLVQSAYVLEAAARPAPSPAGMAWLAATVAVMVALARGKLLTGRRLGNAVLMTEARVTLVDAILAASVLAGLGLNAGLGWWWADPLSGLALVYYGVREAITAWPRSS